MAEETVTPETTETKRGYRKTRQGVVTSDSMDKTIVVTIMTLKPHPLYGRTLRRSRAFKAHDETNDAHTGDTVQIMECRPVSKEKCWRLVRVIERAK